MLKVSTKKVFQKILLLPKCVGNIFLSYFMFFTKPILPYLFCIFFFNFEHFFPFFCWIYIHIFFLKDKNHTFFQWISLSVCLCHPETPTSKGWSILGRLAKNKLHELHRVYLLKYFPLNLYFFIIFFNSMPNLKIIRKIMRILNIWFKYVHTM